MFLRSQSDTLLNFYLLNHLHCLLMSCETKPFTKNTSNSRSTRHTFKGNILECFSEFTI